MDKVDLMLRNATQQFKALRLALVDEVDPASISRTAKIPFKILLAREALLYRAVDLGEASCLCFQANNIVSGACLSRALQETVAVLFYVNRKSKKAILDNDLGHLDEYTMKVLMGSKDDDTKPDPVNILTMINHVDKEVPKFRAIYDKLSEVAHPNWHGTLGIFSSNDYEKLTTSLGTNVRLENITRGQGISALLAGVEVLVFVYDEFAEFLPELIEICEKDIEQTKST